MLPRVVLHNAVSIDGRMDWFSPDLGLFYELTSMWREDATLVGSNTFVQGLADEPEFPDGAESESLAKDPNNERPLLVVPDSRGRLRDWDRIRRWPCWRNAIALCSRATPQAHLEYLASQRVDYLVVGDDHVDLRATLEELSARYGVKVVRVDSGGTLNGVLLRAGLVDEVSVLISPCLVGGTTTTHSTFRAPDLDSAEGVVDLRLVHLERVRGDVVWLRYEVVK